MDNGARTMLISLPHRGASALLVALILGVWAMAAHAQLYTDAELQRVQERAVPNLIKVFDEDIIANLPRDQRARAAQVRIEFPEVGPSPLAFYADPTSDTIYMPLTSIRFFDDIATLFAWVEARSCDPEAVQAYLWRKLQLHEPLPAPLKAFNVDRDTAFADPFTDNVSAKIYSSGLQFILAHELGHLLLDHRLGLTGDESQAQEIAADDFALDHFARLGGQPMGVFWYFMAAWWFDPTNAEDLASYSHPVSPARIARLGTRLVEDPMSFAHAEVDPAREAELARQIGGMVLELSVMIDENGMLAAMPLLMEDAWPASRFATACPSP